MVDTIQFMIMTYHLPYELHKKRGHQFYLVLVLIGVSISFCSQNSIVADCIQSDGEFGTSACHTVKMS